MNRILSGATTQGQSGPLSIGNKELFCIPQSSSIAGTSPSDCLISYVVHLMDSYSFAEIQSEYSTVQADWAFFGESYPNADIEYSTAEVDWAVFTIMYATFIVCETKWSLVNTKNNHFVCFYLSFAKRNNDNFKLIEQLVCLLSKMESSLYQKLMLDYFRYLQFLEG